MGIRAFTRRLNRPAGKEDEPTYYDDKNLCVYVDPAGGCPTAEPKFPQHNTRLHFRFHSITGDKPMREVPVTFVNHGREFQLQNVVVNGPDNG